MNTITANFTLAAASTAVDFEAALQPTPRGVKPDAKYGLNGKFFEPAYYVVGTGDSLPKIAKWAFETGVVRSQSANAVFEALKAKNDLSGDNPLIHPDQTIHIPFITHSYDPMVE